MNLPKGYIMAMSFFALYSFGAFADGSLDKEEKNAAKASDNIDVESNELAWWQTTHQTVSETIGSWSNNMDSFLSGQQSVSASDSQVEIRFGPVFAEESTSGFFDLHAQLELPNTQKRLRLVIESNGDSIAPENVRNESSEQKNVIDSALQSSLSAAVRYIKADLGADFDIGILVDFPLNPFVRLRFTQGDNKERWRWWQKQEAFAYYSKGIGARYGLGTDYRLTSTLNYGADFSVVWLDQESLFYVRENFFLRHSIDKKNRLSYQLSFLQSGKQKIESDTVLYNLQYERFLYKDWLIGQVKPQFTHEAEEDYDGSFSLTLSLAVLLGPKYLH